MANKIWQTGDIITAEDLNRIESTINKSIGGFIYDKLYLYYDIYKASPELISKLKENTDGWFVPSLDELRQIYINCKNKNLLKNITTSFYDYSDTSPCYWSSSEYDKNYAYFRFSSSGFNEYKEKNDHTIRTRLCRYATPSLLNLKWEISEK